MDFQQIINRVSSPSKIFREVRNMESFHVYVKSNALVQDFEKGKHNRRNVELLLGSEHEEGRIIAALCEVVDPQQKREFSGRKFLSLIKAAVRPTTETAQVRLSEEEIAEVKAEAEAAEA